jgi:hypothetical protein
VRLGNDAVSVLRAPTSDDAYGNDDVRDWDAATSTPVTGCSFQPLEGSGFSEEVTVGRESVISRWVLYAPPDTDVLPTDRVQFDGVTYEVDGEPQRWGHAPRGYLSALLRKAAD